MLIVVDSSFDMQARWRTMTHRPPTIDRFRQRFRQNYLEAGVEVALSPGFFRRLHKLPVVEPGPYL